MDTRIQRPHDAGPSSELQSDTVNKEGSSVEGTFVCISCGLEEHYHYRGKHPPFATSIKCLDTSYVMRDPFAPAKPSSSSRRHKEVNEPFLILGGDCKSCKRPVCRDPECSIFYQHHYCLSCASKNYNKFPVNIQRKLKRP
ncbi:hypothetical protein J437_LFUL003580 [Ladona fulva]|uniref:Cysteine-rich DPF motif domain-containing protein 1 n=1 Tax=Ladona fulva TaxID=123851 RepID=A0A8K0JW08_LADFU|nr:hypothetical protein J437_LFUL003580 [Ladona fulva]